MSWFKEIIERVRERNLFFSTNLKDSIQNADMILFQLTRLQNTGWCRIC